MGTLRRFAVTIVGVALLVVGAAMMVLPGPGILGIVAGLAVLATEYVWARRLLTRAKEQAEKVQEAAVASPWRTAGSVLTAVGMIVVGILMITIDDVAWPVLDRWIDAVWGPVTGSILAVSGVVVITTTWLTIRSAKGRGSTYTPRPHSGAAGQDADEPGRPVWSPTAAKD